MPSIGYQCAVFEHKGSLFYTDRKLVLRIGTTALGLERSPRPRLFGRIYAVAKTARPCDPIVFSFANRVRFDDAMIDRRYFDAVMAMHPGAKWRVDAIWEEVVFAVDEHGLCGAVAAFGAPGVHFARVGPLSDV